MFEICSIFIFTTNSRVRGERMTDRECIVEYERGHPSEEERESSKLAVSSPKWSKVVHRGPKWSIAVHRGPVHRGSLLLLD